MGLNEKYLVRNIPRDGGVQKLYRFDNGYGASVLQCSYSYGYEDDLWEMSVIKWDGDVFDMTFDTPIADDVLGYLDEDDVNEVLAQIEEL